MMILLVFFFGLTAMASSIDGVFKGEVGVFDAFRTAMASSLDVGYASFIPNFMELVSGLQVGNVGTVFIFFFLPILVTWMFTLMWVSIILDIVDMSKGDIVPYPVKLVVSIVVVFIVGAIGMGIQNIIVPTI